MIPVRGRKNSSSKTAEAGSRMVVVGNWGSGRNGGGSFIACKFSVKHKMKKFREGVYAAKHCACS